MIREINNNTYSPGRQNQNLRLKSHADISFAQIMSEKAIRPGEVKFSGHAQDRLRDRNITLSPRQFEKLNDTIRQAGEKGARSSLIVLDNLALIVSVKNKTVITAIDKNSMKDNIFTNIDSAAII